MYFKSYILLLFMVQTPVLALNEHLLPKKCESVDVLSKSVIDIIKTNGVKEISFYDLTTESHVSEIFKEIAKAGVLTDVVINNPKYGGIREDSSLGIGFIDSLHTVKF